MRLTSLLKLAGIALSSVIVYSGMSLPGVADDKLVIGFSQATMNHPLRVQMVEGNKKYAAEHYPNVELIVTDGQNDSAKQVADVESLIARGIKVLMISPLTADALTPVVQQALDAGIKVVTLDRQVNVPVTVHVGAHNKPIGAAAGKYMVQLLGGKGNVIEIQGTAGASATNERHDGFVEAIAGTGIKVVAEQHADYLRENAVKFMEDMLQRFPSGSIQAVYAHNDEMALGAIQALEAAGRLNEVKVIGIDGQETAFEAVAAGKLAATFTYPFGVPEGIQAAYGVATGEKVATEIELSSKGVTPENVKDFLGTGF